MSKDGIHAESQKWPAQLPTLHQHGYALAKAATGLALAVLLYFVSRANYPLFHSIVDMATVFIAGSVFLVVWNGRRHLDNNYYLFIAIAFLAFAVLDFVHLIGNQGMGVFPEYGNLGPTFYIASRYVLGISFLLAPLFIKRKLPIIPVFAAYLLVVLLVLLSVLRWRNFPTTYIEGTGLTAFKVYSDYAVCLMLLGGLGLLLVQRRAFDARVLKIIALALVFSIATGLAFTLYADPFGITNAVGHFFQIASFYLVHLGFVETVLTQPQNILYRNLQQSNERVVGLNTELEDLNLSLSRDIAARKTAEEALRRTAEELRRSNDDLKQFAYAASHDLQEPLRMVTAFMGLLQDRYKGQLDANADEYIGFAVDGARRMSVLVTDLLEYSRVGRKENDLEPTDAGQALASALANLRGTIRDAGAVVTHDELPTVMADATQFMQLLQNLLGNAIKFRRDGVVPEIHISARKVIGVKGASLGAAAPSKPADAGSLGTGVPSVMENDAAQRPMTQAKPAPDALLYPAGPMTNDSFWLFSVRDNGIGIPAEQYERIFQVFQRLHTREQYEGTGIGLAICKKIVEQHGGRIWIESKPGAGSTFYFTFPEAKA